VSIRERTEFGFLHSGLDVLDCHASCVLTESDATQYSTVLPSEQEIKVRAELLRVKTKKSWTPLQLCMVF